jgi:hypothetical protein
MAFINRILTVSTSLTNLMNKGVQQLGTTEVIHQCCLATLIKINIDIVIHPYIHTVYETVNELNAQEKCSRKP